MLSCNRTDIIYFTTRMKKIDKEASLPCIILGSIFFKYFDSSLETAPFRHRFQNSAVEFRNSIGQIQNTAKEHNRSKGGKQPKG